MKAEIYQWVRILASFYILFTVILQLIPDKKYERYIRSFMGLLLIYILAIPLLDITGNSSRIIESFFRNYAEEVSVLEQKETENLQGRYIRKGFEKEVASQIIKKCEEAVIKTQEVIVDIEGEKISVGLTVEENLSAEQKRRIQNEFQQRFGLEEQNIKIFSWKDGKTTMDSDSASGGTVISNRTSGIKEEQYCAATASAGG